MRIQVSRDEQAKTVRRIRRAEVHRRERLERSIKAKDDLFERMKAERAKNSKAVISARWRWKREKKAIREKSESWASLHAEISSTSTGETNRRVPSRCGITVLNAGGVGSLSSSLTQPTLLTPTPLPSKVQSQHTVALPRGISRQNIGIRPGNQHRQLEAEQEEASTVHHGSDGADSLQSHTAPASLRCGRIIDAETGEPLELRCRRWKFPLTSPRARTVGSIDAGGVNRGYTTDDSERGVHSSTAEQVDEWRGLWYGGAGLDGNKGEEKPLAKHRAAEVEWARDGGEAFAQARRHDECKARRGERDGGDEGYHLDYDDTSVSECGFGARRTCMAEEESSCYFGDDTHSGQNPSNTSSTQVESALCSDSMMGLEGNTRLSTISSLSPGVRRKKRPYTIERDASLNRRAENSGGSVALPVLSAPFQQGREEPSTPRATERPVSPFWVSCPQEPPWVSHQLAMQTTGRTPDDSNTSSGGEGGGWDDDEVRNASGGARGNGHTFEEERDDEVLASEARNLSGGSSVGFGKRDPSVATSLTAGAAPGELVRKNMAEAQNIRDRYLSQLQQMIMAETTEEDRRAAALRFAVGHPLRIERLQLRHEKEREEKRALISWIRRDIELIVVQKMAALGLIR